MADGKRVTFGVKVSEALAAQIDAARGDVSRSAWLEAAARGRLAGAAPVTEKRAAPVRQPSRVVPAPKFREPAAPREADRKPCRHEHVVKGWCNECKTGGHF
jgi:hypothetical protein